MAFSRRLATMADHRSLEQLIEDGTYFVVDEPASEPDTACGFVAYERIEVPTSKNVTVPCTRMRKEVSIGDGDR